MGRGGGAGGGNETAGFAFCNRLPWNGWSPTVQEPNRPFTSPGRRAVAASMSIDFRRFGVSPAKLILVGLALPYGLFMATWFADPANAACVDVQNPDQLSFAGTLTYGIFPGPPNFTDVRDGDAPEPRYILKLDAPICAIGSEFLDGNKAFDEIQLLPGDSPSSKELSSALRRLIGQHVSVEGKSAFGANTSHHHAPLLLPITSVSVAASVTVPAGTAMTTVQGFYLALRAGDGDEAAKFIVPSKRSSAPFSPTAITNFYSSLTEPITVLGISATQPNEYRVRYTFVPPGKPRCNATSVVRTVRIDGKNLIELVQALNQC